MNILLRPEWLSFLRENQNTLIDWFRELEPIPLHMIVPLAQVLEPQTIKSESLDLDHERFLAVGYSAQPLFEERHEIAALSFALASSYSEERAALLAVASFLVLHRAMAQSRLSYRAWQIIESSLPAWDRDPWALLAAFQSKQWPPLYLWDIIKNDDDLLSDMLRTSKRYPVGREVFSSIWRAIQQGQVSTSRRQAKEIRKLIGA